MDHVLGVSRYIQAFPRVQILAHPYTRELIQRYLAQHEQEMRNTVTENVPGIEAYLASGNKPGATPIPAATVAWLGQFVASAEMLDREYRNFTVTLPNLAFTGDLSIYSGSREIRILHLGAGNTPGDLLLWLPQEKILATGDIVVWPTPYGHGGHAQEWMVTLRKIADMDFRILIPGHGELMSDAGVTQEYLELLAATLESIVVQMQELVAAGVSEEDAVKQLDLSVFEARFSHGDAFLQERLAEWFIEPIAQAAWREANGRDAEFVQ
jgi:glyoxylase-like metal-dependent hydrolase (beta-lactamase superfamily II)